MHRVLFAHPSAAHVNLNHGQTQGQSPSDLGTELHHPLPHLVFEQSSKLTWVRCPEQEKTGWRGEAHSLFSKVQFPNEQNPHHLTFISFSIFLTRVYSISHNTGVLLLVWSQYGSGSAEESSSWNIFSRGCCGKRALESEDLPLNTLPIWYGKKKSVVWVMSSLTSRQARPSIDEQIKHLPWWPGLAYFLILLLLFFNVTNHRILGPSGRLLIIFFLSRKLILQICFLSI